MNRIYQIKLSYATFVIITNKDDIVVRTAPIGKWMKGKSIYQIQNWVKRKNGIIKKI